jgi:hypothetical protein
VYLVGASAPADRIALESHLGSCAGCRDELADLAGLPALLGRVPPDDVAGLAREADTSLLAEQPLRALLSQVAKRRRQRAVSIAAAAVAVGLLAGSAAASAALHELGRQPAHLASAGRITVRGTNPVTDASAVVEYAARPWGVELHVQVSGIAIGTRCAFEVTDSSGQESAAGSWTVAGGYENAWYPASSSVPASAVRGFVVTAGAQPLVDIRVPVTQPILMKGHR